MHARVYASPSWWMRNSQSFLILEVLGLGSLARLADISFIHLHMQRDICPIFADNPWRERVLSASLCPLPDFHLIYNANLNESADVCGRDVCDDIPTRCARFGASSLLNEKRMTALHFAVAPTNLVGIITVR